ncbi:MAG: NADP-dependent isocitrate dehydrogenase [Treponema sp.]|jgi:isocitrate dehydrogenase|nr:NADP-dependent isocitrate dehydrogenase [Treponema sp.]
MSKIIMKNPVVEMDGDEMTRIIWAQLKEELLLPFIDLKTEYYDLGLQHRDETSDQVTVDAGDAIKRLHVGVKCATITPNEQRVAEYHLKKMWKSPNATIRAILDGTVFREPILVSCVKPVVRTWQKSIAIARHAYGDVYKAVEYRVPSAGKAELLFTSSSGDTFRETIHDFEGAGVLQAMHNKDSSIISFAHACFRYALSRKQDLWFSTKDTISKQYDQTFKNLFQRIYDTEYADQFKQAEITYFYTLIDDAIARVIRSKGGFVWACKNYDGDVMSDMVSTAFGSLAMMSSVLVSPDGNFEFEAAHGTVTRHYYRHLKGEETSTNPIAMIFAWSGALRKRGELDKHNALIDFADKLEATSLAIIERGIMTKDLALLCEGVKPTVVNTSDFISEIRTAMSR